MKNKNIKKTVLLFYCYDNSKNDHELLVMPSGLYWIAAQLIENNYNVKVLKISSIEDAVKNIKKFSPFIVGFTILSINRNMVINISSKLKKKYPKLYICLGGPHAHALYKEIMEHYKFIDFVFRGEAEHSFLSLCDSLFNRNSFSKIKGLIYRNKNEIIVNSELQRIEELNKLTIPANYFAYQNIITSRGCTGSCIFCQTPFLWGKCIYERSAENVVNEIELLVHKYGIRYIVFSDDTFFQNEQRSIKIAELILEKELKIRFDARGRANHITEKAISILRKAGLVSVSIGVESVSKNSLKWLKKGISTKLVKNACEILRKYGCYYNLFIIIGNKHENEETVKQCVVFLNKIKPSFVTIYGLHILPGTELEAIAINEKVFNSDYWFGKNPDKSPLYTGELSKNKIKRYIKYINDNINKNLSLWKLSEKELNEIVKENEYFDIYDRLGDIKYQNGDYDKAIKYYSRSIELFRTAETLNKLGDCYDILLNEEKALEYYKQSIFFFNNDKYNNIRQSSSHVFNHAVTYLKLENYAKAKLRLLEAENLGYYSSDLFLFIALCEAVYSNISKASKYIKKAFKAFNGSTKEWEKRLFELGLEKICK